VTELPPPAPEPVPEPVPEPALVPEPEPTEPMFPVAAPPPLAYDPPTPLVAAEPELLALPGDATPVLLDTDTELPEILAIPELVGARRERLPAWVHALPLLLLILAAVAILVRDALTEDRKKERGAGTKLEDEPPVIPPLDPGARLALVF